MTGEFPESEADELARAIEAQARAAYAEFLRLVDKGAKPQDAIKRVQAAFDAAYYASLAEAFSRVLGKAWSVQDMREYRVGGIALSRRLYAHWRDTSGTITRIVAEHAKGVQQLRELALELYEGYRFRPPGAEPLQIANTLRTLPQPLRTLARDPLVRQALLTQARRAASATIRTRALQSAYLQAYTAALRGVTRARLDRLLDVAMHEKVRYFANRIAQTELARAHADRVALELMADDSISVVEWRLSASHPVDDICDVFARVDGYGLGPGRYPKSLAPKPPAHPWCRCRLRSRPDMDGLSARPRPGAERDYLVEIGEKAAARLLGSEERLRRVRGGQSALDVHNAGTKPVYRVPRLGEFARQGR